MFSYKAFFCTAYLCLFSLLVMNAQCIDGDCVNGKGTYLLPSGSKYVGQFINGEIDGEGICYYKDGSVYKGQWTKRLPSGKGKKTYANGKIREGYWLQGLPADKKNETLVIDASSNDEVDITDIQSGCLVGDCKNGEGTRAYVDGSKYQGTFSSGKITGWGTWFFPSGDKYIGNFQENQFHGEGAIYRKDGSRLQGQWEKGEYEGHVFELVRTEGCQSGNCKDGQGVYIFEAAAATYVGSFAGGLPSGYGICDYANGEKYIGEWNKGSFNGQGVLYLIDGTAINGFWKDGEFDGPTENTEPPLQNEKPIVVTTETEVGSLPKIDTEKLNVWVVIIGVSSYEHMPQLKYSDDDAYRTYAFFKSPQGGSLSDDQIKILIDEEATRKNILTTMNSTFKQAGPNDLIVMYFSGHGLKGAFLPIDFDGYNNKVFHEEINHIYESSKASYKLAIVDACHAGSLYASKGYFDGIADEYYDKWISARPGTALIMSSKAEENSLESKGLRQGVFSHFLLRGMKGEADKNQDQIVSVDELYHFVFRQVRSYTGNRQSPVIKGDYDLNMPVTIARELK